MVSPPIPSCSTDAISPRLLIASSSVRTPFAASSACVPIVVMTAYNPGAVVLSSCIAALSLITASLNSPSAAIVFAKLTLPFSSVTNLVMLIGSRLDAVRILFHSSTNFCSSLMMSNASASSPLYSLMRLMRPSMLSIEPIASPRDFADAAASSKPFAIC